MRAERPIFVVGAPRSGTTLLRYMLCAHPRIHIPPESNFIPRFFQRRPREPMQRQWAINVMNEILRYRNFLRDWRGELPNAEAFVDNLPDLMPATFIDAIFRDYTRQSDGLRWGDKSPIYTSYVDLIAEIFPDAQFIHIVRDGRDVALSMRDCYQGARFFYIDFMYTARTWSRRVRKARADGARLGPGRYYELRYEQLVAQPRTLLQEICDFLGEHYVPAMAEPHKVAVDHYHSTGIHAATRQPPTTTNSARWRKEMTAADVRLFQAAAGDLLTELGYDTVNLGHASLGERARYAELSTKFAIVRTAGRILQTVGVFHPSNLLGDVRRRRQKHQKLSTPISH